MDVEKPIYISYRESIIFDIPEALRLLKPFHKFFSVLYMGEMILDSASKNIWQRMLSHKLIAQNTYRLTKFVVCPKPP